MQVTRNEPRSVCASETETFASDAYRLVVPYAGGPAAASRISAQHEPASSSGRASSRRPTAPSAQRTCNAKVAASAAVALRPIPIEAIRAGATVAAYIAATLDTPENPTGWHLRAADSSDHAPRRPAAATRQRPDPGGQPTRRTDAGQLLASKIERGDLDDVKVGDLRRHLRTVGSELKVEYVIANRLYRIA